MATAAADKLSAADVILNRTNVALARSQRLIQSWLPALETKSGGPAQDEDNDDDFVAESEIAGVGSKRPLEDDGLPDGAFKRRKLASNDKLLESLLGKKAAQAHRKSQKPASASVHAPSTAVPTRPPPQKRQDDSEDEEDGRSAAFTPRVHRNDISKAGPIQHRHEDHQGVVETDIIDLPPFETVVKPGIAQPDQSRIKKNKAGGSYLDELLAQRASKRRKKVKKGDEVTISAVR